MCTVILEFGPIVIRCLEFEYPLIVYEIIGQFIRCEFAKNALGSDWGSERAEISKFMDVYTNRTLSAVDFVRNGFDHRINESIS